MVLLGFKNNTAVFWDICIVLEVRAPGLLSTESLRTLRDARPMDSGPGGESLLVESLMVTQTVQRLRCWRSDSLGYRWESTIEGVYHLSLVSCRPQGSPSFNPHLSSGSLPWKHISLHVLGYIRELRGHIDRGLNLWCLNLHVLYRFLLSGFNFLATRLGRIVPLQW